MKRELGYHNIEGSYGGNQEWFSGFTMKMGGCGAETACESSIYFSMYRGRNLYPFDINKLTKKDYRAFGDIMKPYLSPRMSGIDRLDIFIDGYQSYLNDNNDHGISMTEFSGDEPYEAAEAMVKQQIDNGYPIPMLMLNHHDRRFRDYDWHWFIVNGYYYGTQAPAPGPWSWAGCAASNSKSPDGQDRFYIKTATYSEWDWLDFREFWDTGNSRKGGMVIFKLKED